MLGRAPGSYDGLSTAALHAVAFAPLPDPLGRPEVVAAARVAAEAEWARPIPGAAEARAAMDAAAIAYAGRAGPAAPGGTGWRARLAATMAATARPGTDLAAAEARLDAVAAAHPGFAPEIALLKAAGAALPAVLAGTREGVAVLFDREAGVEGLYETSPFAARANRAVAAAVGRLGAGAGPLRVLEVGGGTGGTTGSVLSALPPGSDTLFTDVSAGFLARAADRFGVRVATFDIARNPEDQGLGEAGFDLIVAGNVLHAVADLPAALARLRRMLAPGGILLLVEATRSPRLDVVFGLTPDWWAFADFRAETGHALLGIEAWRDALAAAGFGPVEAAADTDPDAVLLLAGTGGDEAPTGWSVLADPEDAPVADGLAAALGTRRRPLGGEPPARDARDLVVLVPRRADPDAVLAAVLPIVQAAADAPAPPRLWLVTRDGEPALSGGEADPGQAAVAGLARTLWRERPALAGGVLDVAPDFDPRAAAETLRRSPGDRAADRLALRDGRRLRPFLHPVTGPEGVPVLTRPGWWLILGGLGGLGPALAGRLAQRGAARILLASRRGTLDPAARATIEAAGAEVRVAALDGTDADAVAALVAGLRMEGGLAGVIQAAGLLDDAPVVALSPERFAAVSAVKAGAAATLDALTRDAPDLPFLLFSSAVCVLGAPGQATHAAANAALEAVASRRRAAGCAARVIHWGAWSEIGAAAGRVAAEAGRQGVRPITPEFGLAVLDAALAGTLPDAVTVLPVDWPAYLAANPDLEGRALLRDRTPVRAAAPAVPETPRAPPADPLDRILADMPGNRRRPVLLGAVRAAAAQVLGHADPSAVPPEENLGGLGLDSLMAIQLRDRLASLTGQPLEPQLLYDHPSVATLTDHLMTRLFPTPAVTAPPPRDLDEARTGGPPAVDPADLDLDALEDLSDAEALALVARMTRSEAKA